MLKTAKTLQRAPINACTIGARFSLSTTILLMLATLIIMPSNSMGGSAYTVGARPKSHHQQTGTILTGKATYYPSSLNGHKTASGETFHSTGHTAASNRLPLGTDVKVTNLKNGKSTRVKVNDRGPALGNHRIDLSKEAANQIGLTRKEGIAPVRINVLHQPANHSGRTSPSSASDATEAPQ